MAKNKLQAALTGTLVLLALPLQALAAEPNYADFQTALGNDPFQAIVTRVVKKVEWQRVHTRLWQIANVNNILAVGDTLRTGADAKAELLYGDGSVTRIGSQTSLTLSGADRRELHLDGGRVWLHIIKHNAGMKVITPGAVAAVTGTELMVEFDPQAKTTEVTVFEGAVNVTGDVGGLVRVTGGTTTRVPFHAPAAPAAPLDNSKVQEREKIFRPLSLEGDSGSNTNPSAAPNTAQGTPRPAVTPVAGGSAAPVDTPTAAPTMAPVTTNVPSAAPSAATVSQPDLKGQTDKLNDPRLINGSPTSGRVKIIVQ